MAAGDISNNLLLKLRSLVDETSAGFFTDAQLFQYLSSSQNLSATKLLSKQNGLKLVRGNDFEIETLKPLIKKETITISSNSNSISLSSLTDIIEVYAVDIYNATAGVTLPLTKIGLSELRKRTGNSYTSHRFDATTNLGSVYYAVYQGNILTSFVNGTFPYNSTAFTNAALNRMDVYYYAQPTALSTTIDPALPPDTYEAIILYGLYFALTQDKDSQRAELAYNSAEKLISNLI